MTEQELTDLAAKLAESAPPQSGSEIPNNSKLERTDMTTCKEIDPAADVKPLEWKDWAVAGWNEYRRAHIAEILNFQFEIYEMFDGTFEYDGDKYEDLETAKADAQKWVEDFVRVVCGHSPKHFKGFEKSNP